MRGHAFQVAGSKVRLLLATLALVLSFATITAASAPKAHAWAWDPHVRVWFNVNNCAGGQWGWFSSSTGESGWIGWNAGYQGYFDLWRVPTSGAVTRISWGQPGRTCGTRYFNITRPFYSTTNALGWIG